MFDSVQPPVDLMPIHGAEWFFNIGEAIILLAVALYAVIRRKPLLLVILLGTAAAGFVEPLDDTASRLWFSVHMSVPFTIYGRTWAVFFPLGYAIYYGLGSWVVYKVMCRGGSRNALLLLAIAGGLFDTAVEYPWLSTKLYKYYGPQPFDLFGFPLYWAFINTAYLFVVGYAFFLLRDWLRGTKALAGFFIPIVSIGIIYGLAWPTWIAMNVQGPPIAAMWIASAVTMALSAVVIWLISSAAAKYGSPLRLHVAASEIADPAIVPTATR